MPHTSDTLTDLYTAHAETVLSTARRILRNSQCANIETDAEDVAAQVWIQAAAMIAADREITSGWLVTAATHLAMQSRRNDSRRRKVVSRSTDEPIIDADGHAVSLGDVLGDDLPEVTDPAISALMDALAAIPDPTRTILSRHYLDSWTLEEIAFGLSMSISAVKQRLSRGRNALRNSSVIAQLIAA